jgi:hypothetical protein
LSDSDISSTDTLKTDNARLITKCATKFCSVKGKNDRAVEHRSFGKKLGKRVDKLNNKNGVLNVLDNFVLRRNTVENRCICISTFDAAEAKILEQMKEKNG